MLVEFKKINNIDIKHNFFVPFINACYFTPQKHNDIIYLSADGKIISSDPDTVSNINLLFSSPKIKALY